MTAQRKDTIAAFTEEVERHRALYVRMKDAGDQVTPAEIAKVRQAYEDALERLTGAFDAERQREAAARPKENVKPQAVRSSQAS